MPFVSFSELVAGVRAGRLISFPTDTVPALASLPDYADLIFLAKERGEDKPLILMAADVEDIWSYVSGTPQEWEIWQQIMNKYWPGALTLVLPASAKVPRVMNPLQSGTIGVRVPDAALAREILRATGPLATTSANKSGKPVLTNCLDIAEDFPEVLLLNSSEENRGVGMPSTVIKWVENEWQVLRQGYISSRDFLN